jgi:muramoyltetrapeptide carboxypeptidase
MNGFRLASLRESLGYRVIIAPICNEWRYFAGTDDERLASFHAMLADPAIDAMMASRGGYGFSRLLRD